MSFKSPPELLLNVKLECPIGSWRHHDVCSSLQRSPQWRRQQGRVRKMQQPQRTRTQLQRSVVTWPVARSLTHSFTHSLTHPLSLSPPPVEVTVRGKVSIYKQASANWRVEGGQLTDQLFALWISWCFLHAVLLHPGVTLYYSLLHCSLFYIFNDSIVLRTGNWFFFMSFFLPHLFTFTFQHVSTFLWCILQNKW